MPKKVVIIGPAHPLRGGLATFDHRLCKQFNDEGYECCIFSFSLQYPSFLFPGTTQYSSEPPPPGIEIFTMINSIHPINWLQIGIVLNMMKPDLIVVRFWIPLMGPALGTILRRVKKNKHTRVVAITDNIKPHEKRPGDTAFTRYFLNSCDAFITMSEKVMTDLRSYESNKPAKQVLHPLYDNFGEPLPKETAREKLGIDKQSKIALFFGFIRNYKGLDILLDAVSQLNIPGFKLLIAGEFYEDSKPYTEQIQRLGISEKLILKTDFIPDSEVKYFLSAADVVIQPYRNATQSGVTPLAYHFLKPMIVTNVGGLPSLVPNERSGLVCEPNATSIANAIVRYFELGENFFIPHLRTEKEKYSWHNLVEALVTI